MTRYYRGYELTHVPVGLGEHPGTVSHWAGYMPTDDDETARIFRHPSLEGLESRLDFRIDEDAAFKRYGCRLELVQ